ncbi:hypothetical protein BDB00DRAFT_849930 [Zychaea mexicana]|uniref:uncharacterized protein n=1 Tax=Zychaea mexicana TaxID=64656 RepID=UPI0022FE7833|nr:uncharacterized protein BDB00DRAFT_849930 [Zychaea mexicana]KAI9488087.1 hypothetical protein BDB00DRAFT_849930 [Zychaea mexicana]
MENANMVHACHSCQKELSSCRSLRDHLIKVHKLNFEIEQIYQKRGKNFVSRTHTFFFDIELTLLLART